MARWLDIHPQNPQRRLLAQAADCVRGGGVVVYPTDSCYALGCHLGDKAAADRLRRIRRFDRHHLFTLVCRDLSDLATYARVDNSHYRLLRMLTPGPYTFVLRATRQAPRRLLHDKRKTIGLRVPDHPVVRELLELLGEPLLSCTLQLPGGEEPVRDPRDAMRQLDPQVDLVLCAGDCGLVPTTVLDLSEEAPQLIRQGLGDVSWLFDEGGS